MDKQFISKRITELRLDYEISEYQLGIEIGKSGSYIQSLTSMRATPSMQALTDICDFFNISLTEFFNEDIKKPNDLHRIQEKLSGLTEDQLQAIEATIDCFASCNDALIVKQ